MPTLYDVLITYDENETIRKEVEVLAATISYMYSILHKHNLTDQLSNELVIKTRDILVKKGDN